MAHLDQPGVDRLRLFQSKRPISKVLQVPQPQLHESNEQFD